VLVPLVGNFKLSLLLDRLLVATTAQKAFPLMK